MALLTQSSELTMLMWQCKNLLMKYVGHKIWNTNKFLPPPPRPLQKRRDPSSLIDCSAISTGIDKRLLKTESYFPYISHTFLQNKLYFQFIIYILWIYDSG